MAKKRDMIDDIIDIQRDWQAVSNPLGNIAGTLAQDPSEVKVFNPADYKSRPRSNSIFCARVSSENHDVCSKCLDVCPVDAITIEGASVKVSDDCRKCGLCTAVCPTEVFLVQKIMANSLYDQIGRIANAYEQCYVTCTRAMGRLHRMPKENEVVLPCVGAISRELWFSLLADFDNVSVYLPLGICDKCRTTTGEEFLSEQIAQAEEWAERGAGLEVEESELDHELSRAFKRSQFMGSVARAGQTLVAASNPALGGAAAIAKKLQEHSERVFDMQRALEQTAGEKTTANRRRILTQDRKALLATLQQRPELAQNFKLEVPTCDTSRCTMCGKCLDACPQHACDLDRGGRFSVEAAYCVNCGACAVACPENALEMRPCDPAELVIVDEEAERKKRAAEKQRAKLREGKAEAKKQLKRGLDAIERLADE